MDDAVGAANASTEVGDAVELAGAGDHAPSTLADAAVSDGKEGCNSFRGMLGHNSAF